MLTRSPLAAAASTSYAQPAGALVASPYAGSRFGLYSGGAGMFGGYGGGYGGGYSGAYGQQGGMYGSSYGSGGMYGGYGGGMMGSRYGGGMYGGGGMMGMGAPGGWNGDPSTMPAGGFAPGAPSAWQSALGSLHAAMNFAGRLSFLVDENTHALHFFITAMLQLFDRAGSLYGELARFVLRLLGFKPPPKPKPDGAQQQQMQMQHNMQMQHMQGAWGGQQQPQWGGAAGSWGAPGMPTG